MLRRRNIAVAAILIAALIISAPTAALAEAKADGEPAINITGDVTEPTNLPVEIAGEILPETLKGYARDFCDGEAKYGVNMLLLMAIARQETSDGTAGVGASKNNLFGVRSGRGFRSFSDFGESIDNQFRMLREVYIDRGRTTVASVAKIYCVPPESWASAVERNFNDYIGKANEAIENSEDMS